MGGDYIVTAVEFDPEIAAAYQDRYPNDIVIVGDAKQYLLDHYKEFDFIWGSPPCQSHTRLRFAKVDCGENSRGEFQAKYPDMTLYEIIIFLKHHGEANWVIENVIPYYKPLIKEDVTIDRHLYWCNFPISVIDVEKKYTIVDVKMSDFTDFDLSPYKFRKNTVIRNQVDYEVGKHIIDCAFNTVKHKQGGLF